MKKQDQRIQLVASTEFRNDVDKWRREQTDLPSHSEAIRRLVKIALRSGDSETMKMITAIIRPHKYEDVRNALIDIGIEGLSATEIRGFGRQRGQTEIYRGAEYKTTEVPKITLIIGIIFIQNGILRDIQKYLNLLLRKFTKTNTLIDF